MAHGAEQTVQEQIHTQRNLTYNSNKTARECGWTREDINNSAETIAICMEKNENGPPPSAKSTR